MSVQSDTNVMTLQFSSRSENEAFARVAVAAFVSQLDPTMDELTDMKTVISEAVTNCIIHGYDNDPTGMVTISAVISGEEIMLTVSDNGRGIEDLELARQPLYTSKPDMERSGMGFTIMENFMDECEVTTELGVGTSIRMKKRIESKKALYN
ncbi:anti-sigma F factor [Paenibacillus sp. E194]|jgi:stage II sporulation protein AB (anti-sigma F factor)|uniref:Anti-sigma F factor n=4 Tax=Paenibacillus TaxID=44249 RepID=A0A383REP1_PAEAL|nr:MULTISPECIES: anti-sigma F factor [Paenibacillus]EPY07736.1 anti-sigma regulatory factor, serine/threonine protein kinase [Paenibacillus alvei TS-15]EPY13902.1 anti-sigma regulatory factor, serine/threonine protein kinase [Paenibacillus alvei A6-6i-x]KJB87905.1 anti-sigma F factor [Paenibacillus sp. E194]MCM3289708.1 anti-sigma F factor [Paenibacillus sp. MER 180]MCY9530458.1 anti-sigma F factor [Paenibacillus alvei]